MKNPTLALAHHVFDDKKLAQAKALLLNLWNWRKLSPSSPHEHVIKNLGERRKSRGAKRRMATDIINFLEVEDAKLGITFVTLNCDDIPSKIHESEAMKDVYVLLHKSEQDYDFVKESLDQKDEEIKSQGCMIQALREDMMIALREISQMLKLRQPNIDDISGNLQQSQQQQQPEVLPLPQTQQLTILPQQQQIPQQQQVPQQ